MGVSVGGSSQDFSEKIFKKCTRKYLTVEVAGL